MSASGGGDGRLRLLLATGNPHKVEEIRRALGDLPLTLCTPAECGWRGPEPEECGSTFEENAAIKARAYARSTGMHALADDSGLEVDALDGAPGVSSAHWAGHEGTRAERDARNNSRLEEAMRGESRREARFVCVMCLSSPDGRILATTRGTFEGAIAESPRGANGFGYDPYLLVPGTGRTSAELTPEEKLARSHRGAAARAMAPAIARLAAVGAARGA